MPPFNYGTKVNYTHGKNGADGKPRKKPAKYLRVSAGPQRDAYVHDLIVEAVLGRKLEDDETVEHLDGDGLNVDPDNLTIVSRGINTRLRWLREQKAARAEDRDRDKLESMRIPWANQF